MTPNELGRKIESLAFAISTKKTGFLVQGGLLLEGLMKQRIFTTTRNIPIAGLAHSA